VTLTVIVALVIIAVVVALTRPHYVRKPPVPYITYPNMGKGIHVHWVDSDDGGRSIIPVLRELKPAWVRAVLPFDLLGGVNPNFAPILNLVKLCEEWGGEVILVTPDYCTYPRTNDKVNRDLPVLKIFVAEAAYALRGRNVLWELSNEPNAAIGKNQPIRPETFVDYCSQMTAVLPRAKTVSGGMSGTGPGARAYLAKCFALGLGRLVPAIGVHPYGATDFTGDYNRIRSIIGGQKALYCTEYGVESLDASQSIKNIWSQNEANGIPLTVWYDLTDGGNGGQFGLLRMDGTKKPSFDAFNQIT
jgi:hypothetical protein